ncbi:hypothetical protein, partial [Streptomyces sp. NPDC056480]|uniref:hypothetical protein n=1 Tax=Streptomyces sp. NPDC056480 TaxID=3345833 RepID=UPI0036CF0256
PADRRPEPSMTEVSTGPAAAFDVSPPTVHELVGLQQREKSFSRNFQKLNSLRDSFGGYNPSKISTRWKPRYESLLLIFDVVFDDLVMFGMQDVWGLELAGC